MNQDITNSSIDRDIDVVTSMAKFSFGNILAENPTLDQNL